MDGWVDGKGGEVFDFLWISFLFFIFCLALLWL